MPPRPNSRVICQGPIFGLAGRSVACCKLSAASTTADSRKDAASSSPASSDSTSHRRSSLLQCSLRKIRRCSWGNSTASRKRRSASCVIAVLQTIATQLQKRLTMDSETSICNTSLSDRPEYGRQGVGRRYFQCRKVLRTHLMSAFVQIADAISTMGDRTRFSTSAIDAAIDDDARALRCNVLLINEELFVGLGSKLAINHHWTHACHAAS